MQKIYQQSRWQNIVYRANQSAFALLSVIVGAIIAAGIHQHYQTIEASSLYVYVGIPALFILWLAVFNSGDNKVIEHGVEVTEQGVSYINYGEKETINWQDYRGYELASTFGGLFRSIIIKGQDKHDIIFNYYAFSALQRREIIETLRLKSVK